MPVVNLQGETMTEPTEKEQIEKEVQNFLDALAVLEKRADSGDFHRLAFQGGDGRVWAMSAIMRKVGVSISKLALAAQAKR